MPILTVVLPTHQPHPGRLRRTLAGLKAQTLPAHKWETLLIDNASPLGAAPEPAEYGDDCPTNLRLVVEEQLGLSHARRRGFSEARSEVIVMVDDDNVLTPDYLARVLTHFATHPHVGALGGRSVGEFESALPTWWVPEFDGLLACRDLGHDALISKGLRPAGTSCNEYPLCAPIGAGMALRRAAAKAWLDAAGHRELTDRRGDELTSGGDNDIIFSLMRVGWEVAYFPDLTLTHLIPAGRLQPRYLARLNRGIAKSWVQVLRRHDACPWPNIPRWTVRWRQLKSWLAYRAWNSPAAHIRWQGACGHFEGRAV